MLTFFFCYFLSSSIWVNDFPGCSLVFQFKCFKCGMLSFFVWLRRSFLKHLKPSIHHLSILFRHCKQSAHFYLSLFRDNISATATVTYLQQTHIMIKHNFIPYRAQNKVLAHVKWPVWNNKRFLICSGINMFRKTTIHRKQILARAVKEKDGGVLEETTLCSNYFQKCHHHYSFISLHVGGEWHREMVISGSHFSEGILLQPLPLPQWSILNVSGWLAMW